MEQIKSLNALAPFLALTKSASSPRAAADLIIRATSSSNTFMFAELLQSSQIQALSRSEEYSNHLTLLQIFSYGTYAAYNTTPGLPKLNEAQTLKLRQLSFLTLAKNPKDLSYNTLMRELRLHNTRELEDLVISAIYAGLVTGTLDPYNQLVAVSSISPLRDLPPNSIPPMLSTLKTWSTRCNTTLADLENQIASIKADAVKRHRAEREWEIHVERLIEGKNSSIKDEKEDGKGGGIWGGIGRRLGANSAAKRANGGMDGEVIDVMEVDEDEDGDRRGSKSSKKRGFASLGFK